MKLRKARNTDVPQIRNLINGMALRTDEDYKHGHMLARSLTELYEHIRDYTVLVDVDETSGVERVVGCCALESQWDGLAELKAMAIADEVQGQGWGRALVDAVLSECEAMGLSCVYLLTNKMEFFERLGFEPIDMRKLPMRVWSECTNCPKFMVACDEVAMTYQGRQPKPTFIPAVGVNAPRAAHVALGISGAMNSDGKRPPFAPNAPHNGTQHASNGEHLQKSDVDEHNEY
jgi:amino-acid N-acetyltransferase